MENTLESFSRVPFIPSIPKVQVVTCSDIMVFAGKENILPSSTNPTPILQNAIGELLDMVMVCHHLDQNPRRVSLPNHVRKQTG